MRFFFDNCIAPAFAEAINALIKDESHQAIHLTQMFKANTPDIEWLEKLGHDKDWIIISGDLRITRRKHEADVWLQAGITTFFLAKGWPNLSFWEQIAKLIQKWPAISDQAQRVSAGAGFIISPRSPKFEQVHIR